MRRQFNGISTLFKTAKTMPKIKIKMETQLEMKMRMKTKRSTQAESVKQMPSERQAAAA